MAISPSEFSIRVSRASDRSGGQGTTSELDSVARSVANDGNQAHSSTLSRGEPRTASHELLDGANLGKVRDLLNGIFSPETLGIFAAIAGFQQLNKYLEETKRNATERNEAKADDAKGAAAVANVPRFSSAADRQLHAADQSADKPQLPHEDGSPEEAGHQRSPTVEDDNNGAKQNNPGPGRTDDSSIEAGYGGERANADLARRVEEGRRAAASASGIQEEMRALLERAVGVMEAFMDQSPTVRIEDLKRRVAALEQRANNDRSNARS